MPNWTNVDLETVREVAREAEVYLHGQLNLAISADQRAAVLGGIYTAAGTAIVAGLIAASSLTEQLFWGGFVSAAMFLVGAGLCVFTALPGGFYLPGNQPQSWYADIDDNKPLLEALGETAENSQEEIEHNRAFLQKNAKRFRLGAFLGVTAPLAGIVIWFLLSVQWPAAKS